MSINVYEVGGQGTASVLSLALESPRGPQDTDIISPGGAPYQVGQYWRDTSTGSVYVYSGGGVWISGGVGASLNTLTGDTGPAAAPSAGNINIIGTDRQILTASSGHQVVLSYSTNALFPGDLEVVGITVTDGGISSDGDAFFGGAFQIVGGPINIAGVTSLATAGSDTALDVSTASGTGITATFESSSNSIDAISISTGGIKVPVTTVAAGASPRTCDNRFGKVSFSGVSIAASATQSFVINNAVVTGSSTVAFVSMAGATTGSAPVIQSIATSAGGITIVVANAAGATTTTANITFTFWVMD